MTNATRHRSVSGLQIVLGAIAFVTAIASASADTLTLAQRPLYAGGNVPPMVMIDL
jgi:type IV pilus assembly protein PilY1